MNVGFKFTITGTASGASVIYVTCIDLCGITFTARPLTRPWSTSNAFIVLVIAGITMTSWWCILALVIAHFIRTTYLVKVTATFFTLGIYARLTICCVTLAVVIFAGARFDALLATRTVVIIEYALCIFTALATKTFVVVVLTRSGVTSFTPGT